MSEKRRVLICGGGLAGLSAAIALGRVGKPADIVELASPEGAAISITTVDIGNTIEALENADDAVHVTFRNGARRTYDLVIGADGIASRVRTLVHGEAIQPVYTGHMGFRCVFQDGPPGAPGFYALPDSTMVAMTRLPGGLVYLATGIDMEDRFVSQAEARQLLRDILERYSAPLLVALRARLNSEQEAFVIARPDHWLMVPEPWHRGRVALIGDAAHATTAHLAFGGGMALEDSVVLAQELRLDPHPGASLDRFEKRRVSRTRLVVESSVELLRLQQAHASTEASAAIRARAVATLAQPY